MLSFIEDLVAGIVIGLAVAAMVLGELILTLAFGG